MGAVSVLGGTTVGGQGRTSVRRGCREVGSAVGVLKRYGEREDVLRIDQAEELGGGWMSQRNAGRRP